MGWPTARDYKDAVQNPSRCFEDGDLGNGQTLKNERGPKPWPGKNAHVFKIESSVPGEAWAVKCFLNDTQGMHDRYQKIAQHLNDSNLPYTIKVEHLSRGIRVGGQWYPIVKMPWVEGIPLNRFVSEFVGKPDKLEVLAELWLPLAEKLRSNGIAHGDLQHNNVLMVQDRHRTNRYQLTLVDYDGMYVPDLSNSSPQEVGHPCYQHPQRLQRGDFNGDIDRFSHLVIYCAIQCLKAGGPSLWKRFDNGQNLLFRENDFRKPEESDLFRELWKINDQRCRALVGRLFLGAKGPLDAVPLLSELVGAVRTPQLTPGLTSRIESLFASHQVRPSTSELAEPEFGSDEFDDSWGELEEPQPHPMPMLQRSLRNPRLPNDEQPSGSNRKASARTPQSTSLLEPVKALSSKVAELTSDGTRIAWDLLRQFKILAIFVLLAGLLVWGFWDRISNFTTIELDGFAAQLRFPSVSIAKIEPAVPVAGQAFNIQLRSDRNVSKFEFRVALGGVSLLPTGTNRYEYDVINTWVPESAPSGRALEPKIIRAGTWVQMEPVYDHDYHELQASFSLRPSKSGPLQLEFRSGILRGSGVYTYSGVTSQSFFVIDSLNSATTTSPESETTSRKNETAAPPIAPKTPESLPVWRSVRTLTGNNNRVSSVAFSPDGLSLASGSLDETVRLWRIKDSELIRTLQGHINDVTSVAFSPDGLTLASGSFDRSVRLWRVTDGELIQTLNGHTGLLSSVAFSPDGATLASGGSEGNVVLWRVADGKKVRTLDGHAKSVSSVAFSPDGATLASGCANRTVKLWRVTDGELIRTLDGHPSSVYSVAFSPDGATLASGCFDGDVRLWRVTDGELIQTLDRNAGSVSSVAFSPDGTTLASGSANRTVKLWRVTDGGLIQTLEGHTDWVSSVTFSPDGATLASGDSEGNVILWEKPPTSQVSATAANNAANEADLETESPPEPPTIEISRTEPDQPQYGRNFHIDLTGSDPRGEFLVLQHRKPSDAGWSTAPQGHVTLSSLVPGPLQMEFRAWNPRRSLASAVVTRTWTVGWAPWREIHTLRGHKNQVNSVAFSHDGKTLATAGDDETVRLWQVSDGKSQRSLPQDGGKVLDLAFSRDGKALATGSADKAVRLSSIVGDFSPQVWGGSTKQARTRRGSPKIGSYGSSPDVGHQGPVWSIALSPDDSVLASGSSDKSIRLWETGKMKGYFSTSPLKSPIKTISVHKGTVHGLAFSSDGKILASASTDKTVRVWRVSDGELVYTYKGHNASVWSVAFAPDDTFLVSSDSDGVIQFWSAETGESLHTLTGHADAIRKLAFSPDGVKLASAGMDKTIRLWRVSDGELLQTLTGHDGPVVSVAFSPDGSSLASASADGTARLWAAGPLPSNTGNVLENPPQQPEKLKASSAEF